MGRAHSGCVRHWCNADKAVCQLDEIGRAARVATGDIVIEGDAALYDALTGLIEPLTPNFPIVTR
jgi:ubiquinone biosynthesis protein UbiJ